MENKNRSSLLKFAAGVLVGVALTSWFHFQHKTRVTDPTEVDQTQTKAPKAALRLPTSVAKNAETEKIRLPSTELTKTAAQTIAASAPPEPIEEVPRAKTKVTVTLSVEEVEELEGAWNDLRQQVEIETVDRGWKISKVAPGSLFASTGFQEGDLVTREALYSLFQEDEAEEQELAKRVINIFEYVSR